MLVAIQDDGENGMGGLLGGRGTAAFGAHSASVLTKTTLVLVVLFFVLAVSLAMVNKSSNKVADSLADETNVEASAEDTSSNAEWWQETAETAETAETEAAAE